MKIMKKIAVLVLTLCLTVPGFSSVVNAAEGTVSFTDPKTKTGETVEVTCALRSGTGSLDTFDITLKYDPAFLAFEDGAEGVTKVSDGEIKFSGKGTGTNLIRFTMNFQALQIGTTKIEVSESSAVLTDGNAVDCTNGNSTIEIAEGTTPVTPPETTEPTQPDEGQIVIGNKTYTFSENFQSSDIPVGYVETTMTYDGGERKFVRQENGNIKLGYLVDAENKGAFFLYNEENATFSPYVQVTVSPTTVIILLEKDASVKVPEDYEEIKLLVNEYELPAWQDTKHEGFYLVYASNLNGEKGFYQYDKLEGSYQRFIAADTMNGDAQMQKVSALASFIQEHLSLMILVVGLGFLVLLIIVIVLAVKLRHRNEELDDLYDEYDIDDDDDDDDFVKIDEEKTEKRTTFKKQPKEEFVDDEDDFDNDLADYYDDDDFEDEFADDFADEDEDFADDEYDEDDFDDEFNEYYDDDDFEEPKKNKKEDDFDFDEDDFEIDFIDL